MSIVNNILSALGHRPCNLFDFAWLRWDAEGSRLFENMTEQDEYYLTRVERHLFQKHADEIIEQAVKSNNGDRLLRIVELGAGTAKKTGILLAATVKRQGPPVEYLPVDISSAALEEAKSTLEQSVPGVHVTPQNSDYATEPLKLSSFDGCTLVANIGSSIGPFSFERAVNTFQNVRRQLQPGDALLLGVDMKKDPAIFLRAYNDQNGAVAAFFLNTLHRLNHEFGFDFNLDQFRHQAVWNEQDSRVDVYMQSLCSQRVRCVHDKNQEINFDKDEKIFMGYTIKYSNEQLEALITKAGFEVERIWVDENRWWTVVLARIPSNH